MIVADSVFGDHVGKDPAPCRMQSASIPVTHVFASWRGDYNPKFPEWQSRVGDEGDGKHFPERSGL